MAGSNVTVCVRLRPFLGRETGPAVAQVNGNTVRIRVEVDQLYGDPEVDERQFVYDLCLSESTSQLELYQQVGTPILQNILSGFNGTLFAYGQTGSGKSFSIMGPEEDPGIIPRLTEELMALVGNDTREEPTSEMRVTLSFLEIYNEEIKDLLDPRPRQKRLYVHQHPKLGVYVPHLTEAAATSVAECARLLDFGHKIRATAQTNMNSTSSRSHSVLTLRVTQVFPNGVMRNSSVNLCDLAGSERVKKTGASGQRKREGSAINQSLSVLGQVISKLAAGADKKKGGFVPFRQSKLTHLLHDALSGNSVTTMLANVSPAFSEADESLSTLRFAESVKKIKTKPQITEMAPEEPALLLESFKSEIAVLQEVLKKDSTCLPAQHQSQLQHAIEASEQLMKSFAKQSGGGAWAMAVEQTKVLEAVQQQLLEEMSLPVHEVGRLAGVVSGTPYLLNISDDPALSGCLLYFLREEPAISSVGHLGPNSISPNNIVLQGLGIPARLCELRFKREPMSVRICKVCGEASNGRVIVNGEALARDFSKELKHGDRLVFGWAFCFRLVISSGEAAAPMQTVKEQDMFETVDKEVLQYSMTSSMSDLGMLRAAARWQKELDSVGATSEEMEEFMSAVGKVFAEVEEANEICSEVKDAVPGMLKVDLDVGVCRPFVQPAAATARRLPTVVVQVWKRNEGADHQLLAAWPFADFQRRLLSLRDAHREVVKKERTERWAWRLSKEEWWAGEAPLEKEEDEEESDNDASPATDATAMIQVESP
eukprot:gb/GFBE01003839.1/.p1 GENE.gb/GFBE01003839.1/~~gb/GFBE01003839.1/.p1  ORF type:complete len:767 (+),score=184.13 gb/GFBE01003839.1/:1-2301(+)